MAISKEKNCRSGFDELILDYIYQEMSVDNRLKFQSHLPDCIHCTTEIDSLEPIHSAVSDHVAFAFEPLRTPRIVVEPIENVGFFHKLSTILSGFKMQTAFGSLAAIMIVAIVGTFYFYNVESEELAVTIQKPDITEIEKIIVSERETKKDPILTNESRSDIESSIAIESNHPVKKPREIKVVGKSTVAKRNRNVELPVKNKPDPVEDISLAEFEDRDESDQGLRLSELFDDEGV